MPDESKLYYRRNLPHWQRPGAAIFLTWHLDGSLPRSARERLAATRTLLEREAARADEDPDQRKARHSKKLFAMLDQVLDTGQSGPLWLKQEGVAAIVESTLLQRYGDLYSTGQTFWQQESFDHWARDEAEFCRIIAYIENNPVKAGSVSRPEDWRWSSAHERLQRGCCDISALT
jgi:putative transposase